MSKNTPWGESQSATEIADGIISYTTAGHGGIWLSCSRIDSFPKKLLPYIDVIAGESWFEEDCEWAFVAIAYPQFFSKESLESAERTLRNTYPAAWEAFYGKKLEAGDSSAKDQKDFYEKHANDHIVVAAWGSWAEHVPQGMVGVMAMLGGGARRGNNIPHKTYWLIPSSEYKLAGKIGFVVDPTKHQLLDVELGEHGKAA